MIKRIFATLLCLCMVLLVGCNQPEAPVSVPEASEEEVASAQQTFLNPLTGVSDCTAQTVSNRPVAIMINNLKMAQAVQTGVNKADIVYETEVEGGITRLMAVYQDLASVGQIGSIRSARYPYVDLALGHDAVYIHRGQDPTYCAPHLKDINDIDVDSNKYAKRISNGLSSEHTLYTFGDTLWAGIKKEGFDTKASSNEPWQTFADEESPVTLPDGACTSVSVPFSTSYKTGFTYSADTGLYTRLFGGNVVKDYKTGESTEVTNVFVLLTSISNYSDGKHRKVDLVGGDGYYISNGTYTFIKWSKGNSKNGFTFTDTEGNPITVNAGKSWVCIADKHNCTPVIQ